MRQSLCLALSKNRKVLFLLAFFKTVFRQFAVCQNYWYNFDKFPHSGYYAKMANYFEQFDAKIGIRICANNNNKFELF